MDSQLSSECKPQPSSPPSFRVNKQRPATWFSKPSFFRFKLKSNFLSRSRSSSKSRSSSLSSDPSSESESLSRPQSPSTTTSKDSIYASTITTTSVSNHQPGIAIKKSSKVRQQTLDDRVSSTFEAPTTTAMMQPVHSTAPQTTPDYRQPISNFFSTIPMVPGSPFHY